MLKLPVLVAFQLLPLLALGQTLKQQTCARGGNSATIQPDANAFIGGIISLNAQGTGGYGCGKPTDDMQAYEAIRWVLELLNKKNEYLQTQLLTDYYVPGIKLGLKMRNYCSKELSAVASLIDIFPELNTDDEACTPATNNFTLGILGASSSGDAIALSGATVDYMIPVVSYEATATQLTMSGKHQNFMRTISPDGPLMEVIARVMTTLQWKFVVVVYDSDDYGRQAFNELHARLIASGICLTAGIMIDADDESTATDTLNRVLSANATGVVYIGPSNYAKAVINAGNGMLPMAGRLQWLLTDMPLDTVFASSSIYQRGIISVSAASRFIVEFEDHWIRINESSPSLENPWFTGWYENRYNCKFAPAAGETNCNNLYQGLSDTDKELKKRAEFQQGRNVEAAVMAVYTYARALRMAQMTLCPGVSGACPALQAMSRETFMNNYVKKVNFTFTADERVPSLASKNIAPYNAAKHLSFTPYGDITDPSYYIYNYNDIETGNGLNDFRFRLVGSYIGSYFDFNINNVGMYSETRLARIPLPPSPCPAQGCMPCLGLPSDIKYYFENGDVVVHGIFSLHQMGLTPLTCGPTMSINQYMFMEAMIYAVRKVNQDSTILNNVILGGLGMDDCSSTVLGQAFLSQVQRSNLQIVDTSGSELNPRKIEAYSAAHTTGLTLPLAEAMNTLMRPMVGYRAGGSQLDDKSHYPYYIRTVPSHQDEIKAIVQLLKNQNWMYVQVVSSSTEYSQDMEKVFRERASRAGICIVATHYIGQTSQDADDVVTGLNVNSATPPAVVLLETADIRRLLVAFTNKTAKIVLIGTSVWGTDDQVVKDLQILPGIITLSIKSSTLDTFKAYLNSLNVNTYTLNPWFKEWYIAAHNCSLGGQGAGAPCNQTQPITAGVNFQLMHEVEGVINAIRAVGYGLDNMLRNVCGINYNSICSEFLTYKNKGMVFLEAIRQVNFNIEDMTSPNTFSFVGNSAAIPFEVNNYYSGTYQMVGEINIWAVNMPLRPIHVYDGLLASMVKPTCASPCTECLFMVNYFDYWYIPGDLIIGGVFDIHSAGSGPFSCGALRVKNGALYTEVFNFALQKINSGTASVKLSNVSLGGLAFDGCTNPHRAKAIVNQIHTGMDIRDSSGNMFMSSSLVSWMSYDSQTTIDTASLVQKMNMSIVSPGATASELDNKKKYYTFFRTIPSDSVVVRGMADFVQEIGKKYVIVLNAPDTSNRQSRDLFREYLTEYGICIVASYEFVTDGSMNVIVSNIDNAQTQVVAVFAEPEMYINDFLSAKNNDVKDNPLIYISNRPWRFSVAQQFQVINSVFFELNVPTFADFKSYLDSRKVGNNNPWFSEIYEEVMGCDLPGTFSSRIICTNGSITSGNWEQDIWTLSTINAIYALAEGVHRTLQTKCGANYASVCPEFLADSNIHNTIMSNMDAENFTDITASFFQFIQREANTNYKLTRFNTIASTVTEGSLDAVGELTLPNKDGTKQLYTSVKSDCAGDCLVCSAQISNLQDFTLLQGDFYIIGLFDIHKQGTTPFTCGAINDKHGLLLQEAFNYALEYVNSRSGIFKDVLPGVMLGGVSFDICQSPSRAAELVSNIQSGNIQIAKDGTVVNPRRIDAYVATMDTESSIRVADILTQLAIPQVSYGAKGMDLLNRDRYSYFLRSVPADDKQARAIVSYLKKFNYNNIQVISSFDKVGEPGMQEFKRLAYINRICVTKEYMVGENGSVAADAPNVINLVQQHPEASVVVLWLKDPLPVLQVVNNNDFVSKNMLFIATDAWGADPYYLTLPSISNLLSQKHLVILDVETADIAGFDIYLEDKTPNNYDRNPWFKEYFEMFLNCHVDAPLGSTLQRCDDSATIPRADNYEQDSYVLYVMNAVFSIALGMDNAIKTLCVGQQTYGACNLYITSGEKRQKIMEGLLKVNFTDDTHQPFYFTEDGQSSRGFHIYNVTEPIPQDFEYQNVGSYNDTHFLKLDITYDTEFKAHCDPKPGGCVCDFKDDLPSRYMKKADGDQGLSVVYIGDIHQASPTNPLACGPINTGADLQKLLAFFYAIEQVNSNRIFPNSLKLDGLALDSCTHGLRLGQDIYNVLSGNVLCDSDNDGLLVSPSTITAVVVDKDENAQPVVSMLSQQRITSISPTAGSSLLNDRFVYPYFLRVRGDNIETSKVILDIAHEASWDYLSVVYTDTLGYSNMADSLLDSSRQSQACVGASIPLPPNATLEDAQNVVQRLSQQVGARAVVLFVNPDQVKLMMQATQSLGLTGRFVWVMASDWDQDTSQLAGFEQELAGALVVNVRSAILANFTAYVKSLTYRNRRGIPTDWFEDIYETLHQCNILNLERPSSYRYSRTCTLDEVITDAMVKQDPDVLYVILSVYSVAFGLVNIPECLGSTLDLAACLQLQPQRYDKIYQGISTANVQAPELLGNDNFTFTFDDNGNGQAGYNIWNYRISTDTPYSLYKIGDYSSGVLNFRKDLYAGSNLYDRKIPASGCAAGSVCSCQLSGGRTWSYSAAQLLDPSNVVVGGIYKDPLTGEVVTVEAIPNAGDRFSEGWAIILSILACLGGVISLGIFLYLLIMYPVRGGTTILGFILSFGIILMYMMAFPFIAHADVRMCGLRRFGLGLVYSIVYSALMVKLIDCWRVRAKNDPYNIKYSKLGTPVGFFLVTVFFVLVQVMINAEWLILREPGMVRIFYKNQFWPRCTPDDFYDESLVLSLVYIMVIILASLILGLATYRTVKNHRESRWILGILVVSVICWVIWCTASILGAIKVRDAAVVIGLLVNATIMLLLMPIRKLYLLNKYNVTEETEDEVDKQSTIALSQRGTDYNSVYGRQYDNNPKMHDMGSAHGSSYVYNSPHESAVNY